MSKSYAKPTGSSGIQKTALGRTCPSCGDRYLAVVVDDHGRQRRDECGCYVDVVDMEIEDDSDEQLVTDGGSTTWNYGEQAARRADEQEGEL
jgi:hypothetical protein